MQKESSKEENSKEKPDLVKWFKELNKDSGKYAGGKGANLGEMTNFGIPVPPGFAVTAQAYEYFIEKSGLDDKIQEMLSKIDFEDTSQLNEVTKKVRELIENAKMPEDLEDEILESYDHLSAVDLNLASGSALDILRNSAEPIFVAVRSSATTEDLAEASFAGQQDTYLNIKGNDKLLLHVKKCFASLFTSRATYYRHKKGFKYDEAKLSVIVQKMVDADKSGVIFSKNPSYNSDDIIMEAVWGLGEGIVSGKITPDKYVVSNGLEILDTKVADKKIEIKRASSGDKSVAKLSAEKSKHQVLKNHEVKRLAEIAKKLEEHYGKPQDIEFAIEGEEIFIVQTRPITTMAKRIDKEGVKEIKGEVVLEGLAASPGIAVGTIKIIEDLKDLHKIRKGDILVTKMTNPDMVVSMQKSSAILTDDGGLTAHAAIVSREMGIPCIVGTNDATTKLKEGETITVDGYSGKVYKGKVAESEKKEIEKVEADTKTQIKVIVDLPTFAERASKTGLKKVGLTRIEGIIAESGKHPNYFLENEKVKDYEEVIYKGISGIAKYFDEVWVRTSDVRSDEFSKLEGAPKRKEANPMLGFHGIRYSLKNPEILKAELNALKRVSKENKKMGLLLPQVILVEEVQRVKKILKEIDFEDAKVGVMVETPAAVQLIKDLCEEGIDFISFGTNDLTQYILAVDRGNEKVQGLYNELHPAVLHQMAYVIRVCKRYKVETSICGQAGSKKEMAKYLVENGIDSISVNADVAKTISDYVKEVEENKVRGTDKEPRQYEKKKQEESLNEKDNRTEEHSSSEEKNSESESKVPAHSPSQVQTNERRLGKEENMEEKQNSYYDENKEKIDKDIEAIEKEKNSQEQDSGEENLEDSNEQEQSSEESSSEEGEIDSTEKEIPEDVTKEELEKDQNREISDEEKEDSKEYIEEAKEEGFVENSEDKNFEQENKKNNSDKKDLDIY